ncbi:hypothetical protein BGZ83_008859 [Gryganskiella cystojenkinii]|nr:hypothetical protein BGZ83_008859 [Gryganskiella cystojenkinii]
MSGYDKFKLNTIDKRFQATADQSISNSDDEEDDITRFSGLMKKVASHTSIHIHGSDHRDLEQGFGWHPTLQPAATGIGGSHRVDSNKNESENEKVAIETPMTAAPGGRTIFSNMINRLFGSRPPATSPNASPNPNSATSPTNRQSSGHRDDDDDDEEDKNNPKKIRSAGMSRLFLSLSGPRRESTSSSSPFSPYHDVEAEDLTRNITAQRLAPSKSGGILSNLLKLQALSMPQPSARSRRSRHHHRHRNSQKRRRNVRQSSFTSDMAARNSGAGRHLASASTSASVLSLPGLIMAAPLGIPGLTPGTTHNTEPLYTTSSKFLETPHLSGEHQGLRISTSADALSATTVNGDSPTTPNGTPMLVAERPGGSSQYLQTHHHPAYSTRSSISMDDSTSMYSGISNDPLLSAIRLNQQAELTGALADILQRQDLLIRLCKSLIRYGAPSHRIEMAMEAMCKTFGVDGSFAFLPGLMMISFGDTDTHTSETHLIKVAQGFDMGRLAKVNRIARAVVYGQIEPGEALTELKAVNSEKQPYGLWIMLVSYAVSSGLIAPLVFKGSWYDMLAGMGLGSVVGLTSLLASRYSVYSNVFEVSTSILIAFVAKALRDYVCFTGVVLAGIVSLLPGLSLTTAIMELSSRYMISGSVRMFYSLIYCLFLGFGLSIGSNLWDVFREPPPGDLKMGYCHPATEPWRWILFPLLAIAFSVQLYATPKQWPVMVICSSVGYAVSEFAGMYWPHSLHIAAAVSAFVVGLLGNIYERLTHELAFIPILGAILLIVPGGMGVRSSLLLLDQSGNASQGTTFALQMILVALGIAVGLFASTLVVYPLGKKRNALLTF